MEWLSRSHLARVPNQIVAKGPGHVEVCGRIRHV